MKSIHERMDDFSAVRKPYLLSNFADDLILLRISWSFVISPPWMLVGCSAGMPLAWWLLSDLS
jgi:hypothetical protein